MTSTDSPPRANERRERFRRLAAQRTNGVLEKLRVLGNCANKYQYSYNDEEISKIFDTIDAEVKRIRSLFTPQERTRFEL